MAQHIIEIPSMPGSVILASELNGVAQFERITNTLYRRGRH